MTQLSLFTDAAPAWPEARCGLCVHRNARTDRTPLGYCTPVGMRHANEAACDQFFGREQLFLACAHKPPSFR